MTDTYDQNIDKKWDLDFLYDMAHQAIEIKDFSQALKISKKALDIAKEYENTEGISKFEKLYYDIKSQFGIDNNENHGTKTDEFYISGLQEIHSHIRAVFNDAGFYMISNELNEMQFMQYIDNIACKIIQISEFLDIILIIPIKISNQTGTMIIEEEEVKFLSNQANLVEESSERREIYTAEINRLKLNQDQICNDLVNGGPLFECIQHYLQVDLTIHKSLEQKKLFFISGQLQYNIYIDPILICKNHPGFIEKSIPFAYQKNSNLHILNYEKLSELLYFLEKKHIFIESYSIKEHSFSSYQSTVMKFKNYFRLVSFPFLGLGIFVLIILISQASVLLKLFNSIGYGAIGAYIFILGYTYLLFYKKKKEISKEFHIPYYQKEIKIDEGDLFLIKNELSRDLMAQFGYECFGKEHSYKILYDLDQEKINEQLETKSIKNKIEEIYEPEIEQIKDSEKLDLVKKYSSFLKD